MTQSPPTGIEKELTFTRFDRMSVQYPELPAVVFLGETFSYRRLRDLSERFAGALADMGIARGDRVMVYIANSVQWVIAFLGIQRIGAVIVPVSPIYTSHEITYMIRDGGVQAVVCSDTNFGYVREALAQAVAEVMAGCRYTTTPSHTSKGGAYHCLNVETTVESEPARLDLYDRLRRHPAVLMVL